MANNKKLVAKKRNWRSKHRIYVTGWYKSLHDADVEH